MSARAPEGSDPGHRDRVRRDPVRRDPGFAVPGYDLIGPLDDSRVGDCAGGWLARDAATGEAVVLERLCPPGTAGVTDTDVLHERLRCRLLALGAVTHPHLAPLGAVVPLPDELVAVVPAVADRTLAGLLAVRERLTAGEVVTVAAPLAQALAALHASGLAHGAVEPISVLLTDDGRPVLAGLGAAARAGVGAPGATDAPGTAGHASPDAAGDVAALGALCATALAGPKRSGTSPRAVRRADPAAALPAALVAALAAASDPDPARRPDAGALAAALLAACPPRPVRMSDAPGRRGTRTPTRGSADPLASGIRRSAVPADAAQMEGGAQAGGGRRPRPRSQGEVRERTPRASRGSTSHRPGLWRSVVAGAGAVLALLLAAVVGVSWAGTGERTADVPVAQLPAALPATAQPSSVAVEGKGTSAPSTTASVSTAASPPIPGVARPGTLVATDWVRILAGLDRRRAAAFATGDAAPLTEVYASSSPALARDRMLLGQFTDAGARASELRLQVRSARMTTATGDRVVLRVVDRLAGYALLDRRGRVLERRPGRGDASWDVTLARVGRSWRIVDVVRAST